MAKQIIQEFYSHSMLQPSVDVQYDLKVVWVNDMLDDDENSIK